MARVALHGAMLGVILIWGIAYTFIADALRELSPLGLATLRHLLAVGGFAALLAVMPALRRLPARRDVPRLLALGILTVIVYHLALYQGQEEIPPGTAALLVSSVPAMTAVLSFLVLGDRLRPMKAAGLGLAFAGVAVVAALGTPGQEASLRIVGLSAIVLLSPLSTALMTVFGKPLAKQYGGPYVAAWTMFLGTAVLAPVGVPLTWHSWLGLSARGWLAVGYLGLLSTTLAFALYYHALQRLQPIEVTAFILIMPIVAVLYAAWSLGTPITAWVALGGALVLGGVALTNLAAFRAARAPAPPAAEEPAPEPRNV